MRSAILVVNFLLLFTTGNESYVALAEEDGSTYSAYEDRRVQGTDQLITAISSNDCSVRWEGIKAAIASWENALYLHPEIEKRTEALEGPVRDRLLLVKQFIHDEAEAMIYREELEKGIDALRTAEKTKSKADQSDLSQIKRALEKTSADDTEEFFKRVISLDLLIRLGPATRLSDALDSSLAGTRLVRSNLIVMKNGFLMLEENSRKKVIEALLNGLADESFSARYVSQRSLETLSNRSSSICVDPTDIPSIEGVNRWRDWWNHNYAAVVASPK